MTAIPVPRKTRVRNAVLSAASDVLRRDGYAGLTMERVAAESGVAKTTLYRSWPTKAALCMDLYLDVAGRELHDPETGDVVGDLKAIAEAVVSLQKRTVAGPAFIGLIAESQLRPETRSAFLAEFAERGSSSSRPQPNMKSLRYVSFWSSIRTGSQQNDQRIIAGPTVDTAAFITAAGGELPA